MADITKRNQRPARQKWPTTKANEIRRSGESLPGLLLQDSSADDQENTPTSSFGSKGAATVRMPGTTFHRQNRTRLEKLLAPDKFAIYHWQHPQPKNFATLSESRKIWKRNIDNEEAAVDFDDGVNDWYELGDEHDVRCIASTWVNRAKRAFRISSSWADFAEDEKNAYNESIARAAFSVPAKAIVMSNALRMDVFHVLKKRLHEEIWLEAHKDGPGLVRLPIGSPQVDSVMSTSKGRGSSGRRTIMPTAEEAARGVRGWTVTTDGVHQPFYEGETEAPVGIVEQLARKRAGEGLWMVC